jgi:hypothetical protein
MIPEKHHFWTLPGKPQKIDEKLLCLIWRKFRFKLFKMMIIRCVNLMVSKKVRIIVSWGGDIGGIYFNRKWPLSLQHLPKKLTSKFNWNSKIRKIIQKRFHNSLFYSNFHQFSLDKVLELNFKFQLISREIKSNFRHLTEPRSVIGLNVFRVFFFIWKFSRLFQRFFCSIFCENFPTSKWNETRVKLGGKIY